MLIDWLFLAEMERVRQQKKLVRVNKRLRLPFIERQELIANNCDTTWTPVSCIQASPPSWPPHSYCPSLCKKVILKVAVSSPSRACTTCTMLGPYCSSPSSSPACGPLLPVFPSLSPVCRFLAWEWRAEYGCNSWALFMYTIFFLWLFIIF